MNQTFEARAGAAGARTASTDPVHTTTARLPMAPTRNIKSGAVMGRTVVAKRAIAVGLVLGTLSAM